MLFGDSSGHIDSLEHNRNRKYIVLATNSLRTTLSPDCERVGADVNPQAQRVTGVSPLRTFTGAHSRTTYSL